MSQPPLPVLMWGFLVACCVGDAQLVLWFLSEEIVLYVAVYLVCLWEEVEFGIFLLHHLEPEFLLWCSTGNLLFSSFLLCLLFGIHCRKNLSPSLTCTRSFIPMWIHWYLFYYLGVIPYCHYFVAQIIPALGAVSLVTPLPFWYLPIFIKAFPYFLRLLRYLYFPCPGSKTYPFSRKPWLFFLDNGKEKLRSWSKLYLLLLKCHCFCAYTENRASKNIYVY